MVRYALVIGIANYEKISPNLPKAVTDAEAIAQILEKKGNFQDVERLPRRWIKEENRWEVALDKKLTAKDLGEALKKFLLEKAKHQEALIYFAGHGLEVASWTDEKKGFLATSDCSSDGRNGIWLDDLNKLIGKSEVSNLVMLLDCCHAGYALERKLLDDSLTAFGKKTDYYLITACRGFEKALEAKEHGVFTGAVLKGLGDDNADEDGRVSGDRLFDLITSELKGSGQEPIRMGWGRSITLVQYPPKQKVQVVKEECPYQGLRYFDEKQKEFFFGREKVIQLLWQKLGQANFVPIIGASGSGKSSVVRAGLIPKLKENGWELLAEPILPGVEPLAELKRAFNGWFERSQLPEIYSLMETAGLAAVIERLPGSKRLLLVVDQFEEVFTLRSSDKDEQTRRFIELLTKVAEIPDSRLAIVTTMRADFLEYCLSYESLTELIQNQSVYMPPLLGAELEEAIAKPAHLQGYHLETGLLGAILDEVGKEKDCLPLLQFALTELWEKRDNQKHQLTLEQYQVLGGVAGALNRHVEKVYRYKDFQKDLPQLERTPQEQEWIKRIFLRLVRTGEGEKDTRQRQTKAKLLGIAKDNLADRKVINHVLEELIFPGRLLAGGDEGVDLAHEALIESWQRFVEWRQENRELRRLIDRIEVAFREWLKHQQDVDYLLPRGLLGQVRSHLPNLEPYLTNSLKEYYEQSNAYEEALKAKYEDNERTINRLMNIIQQISIHTESTFPQLNFTEVSESYTQHIFPYPNFKEVPENDTEHTFPQFNFHESTEGFQLNPNEAATEIQELLEKLSHNNPTPVEQEALKEQINNQIQINPTLKQRMISVMKAGGTEAITMALNHPAVNVALVTLKHFLEDE
ncbi:caspase family protein [Aerosakkonema funiforme]|uniref:nSTAND1 domain-containing NTPase n=1 Tax=Aerosakkonema funiforme TaxID=1246630 RepID=UPI0035B77C68